ncbi:MAG: DUF2760 domain-containing protein [Planctomycetota bacterium]
MGLGVAFRAFFSALFNKDASARIAAAMAGSSAAGAASVATPTTPPAAAPPKKDETDPRAAYVLLSALQTEGRLVDFLREEIDGLDDSDIGVAVREVHRGCREVLDKYFTLEPVRSEPEGEDIKVAAGYDPAALRVIGSAGSPPFTGTLRHRGWKVAAVKLPTLTGDEKTHRVIAPAELETGG